MAAIFHNEAPYLREWLEFHRMVGVAHFYLYDHGSTDESRSVLAPYQKAGLVTLTPWPLPWKLAKTKAQVLAYAHAIMAHGEGWRWMAFIDVDEFLFPVKGDLLPDLLAKYADQPAVVVPWTNFGASGHARPAPGLVIENHTESTSPTLWLKYKTICNPAAVRTPHIHLFGLQEGGYGVNENGQAVYPNSDLPPPVSTLFRLNHYFIRSNLEFDAKVRRKEERLNREGGMRLSPEKEQKLRWLQEKIEKNVAPDEAILRFVPRLKARLEGPLSPVEMAP
jgi:hypothetical protein